MCHILINNKIRSKGNAQHCLIEPPYIIFIRNMLDVLPPKTTFKVILYPISYNSMKYTHRFRKGIQIARKVIVIIAM